MGVNKVVYGDETVIDISDSTVTPETLALGETAYDASGEKITGTNEGAISHTHEIEDVNGLRDALPYAEVKKIGGITRKCTNLIPYPYVSNNKTVSGLTWSVNDDRSIKVSGTSTGTSTFSFVIKAQMPSYPLAFYLIFSAEISGVQPRVYLLDEDDTLIKELRGNIGSIISFSAADYPTAKKYTLEVAIITGVTVNNLTVKPMLNEGSTALPYEPYFEGLRDAKATEMKSVGANLFDKSKVTGATQTETGFSFTNTGDSGVPYAIGTLKKVAPNLRVGDTVTFYADCVNAAINASRGFFYLRGSQTDWFAGNFHTITQGDLDSNIYAYGVSGAVCEYNNVIITKIANAPYTPYMESTLPIPEAVQALDGYGWGINADCYNYADCEKKQFVKRVEKVVFDGTEAWVADVSNVFGYKKLGYLGDAELGQCSHFANEGVIGTAYMKDKTVSLRELGYAYFKDTGVSTVDEWKGLLAEWYAAGTPLTLIYVPAEPVITDISDLLPEDNHIRVENGGTITAVNEYGYDVPFEISNTSLATKALGDRLGQQIDSTYIKDLSATDNVITYTKGDGTTGEVVVGGTASEEEGATYLGMFDYGNYVEDVAYVISSWIEDNIRTPNATAYFVAPVDLIPKWNEYLSDGGDGGELVGGSNSTYIIEIETIQDSSTTYVYKTWIKITSSGLDGIYYATVTPKTGALGEIKRVVFAGEDTDTYTKHFSGWGDIGMTNVFSGNLNSNMLNYADVLQGAVEYIRTSQKSGLLSINTKFYLTNRPVFNYISLRKIGNILGLNFKSPAAIRNTGVWYAHDPGATTHYSVDDLMGLGAACAVTPDVIGDYDDVSYGPGIQMGRYYATSGAMGAWAADEFLNMRVFITNVYVEEE